MNIDALLTVMSKLRDPERGCPWDIEQDFASVAPYTVEEAYEVADAIERGDLADLRDELGDLLLQVVFHAQMAKEQGAFDFEDVVAAIVNKLISRHPHVFSGESVQGSAAQTEQWEQHKQREREAKGVTDSSALAGISRGIPEWQRATKLQKRAARTGFEWPAIAPVIAKLQEEIAEVEEVLANPKSDPGEQAERITDEIGDLLFVAVNVARHAGVDPGVALRAANRKFETRFRAMESLASREGVSLTGQELQTMESWWKRIKRE